MAWTQVAKRSRNITAYLEHSRNQPRYKLWNLKLEDQRYFIKTSQLAAQALEPNITSELTPDIQSDVEPEDYSSLNHLLRVTAWVLRFIKNLRGRKVKENNLMARELQTAKNFWEK